MQTDATILTSYTVDRSAAEARSPLGRIGLTLIIGWAANWRPIEDFLYDWRPTQQQCEILGSLTRMEISFPPPATRG